MVFQKRTKKALLADAENARGTLRALYIAAGKATGDAEKAIKSKDSNALMNAADKVLALSRQGNMKLDFANVLHRLGDSLKKAAFAKD